MKVIAGRILCRRIFRPLCLAALVLSMTAPAFAADKRDALWEIVSTCLDPGVKDYCTTCISPREEAGCNRPCRNSTQVWAESKDFVVIRDRKMCGCPEGFVHGLALPRKRVSGVEAPARPEGIWEYAWAAAVRRIPENEIALAVNPRGQRSQDQLHVHLVRVNRESLPADPRRTARVDTLGAVWKIAAGKAAELTWQDYGVLVVKGSDSGYLVVIDEDSTEGRYTLAECH
jgi:CDP-diacylglycerol pyrophosphatase